MQQALNADRKTPDEQPRFVPNEELRAVLEAIRQAASEQPILERKLLAAFFKAR